MKAVVVMVVVAGQDHSSGGTVGVIVAEDPNDSGSSIFSDDQ